MKPTAPSLVKQALNGWFAERGWKPFPFQKAVWAAVGRGESGLLHATTGAGKTYAVWIAALMGFSTLARAKFASSAPKNRAKPAADKPQALTVLWITPMRALAFDTVRALQAPVDALAAQPGLVPWSIGLRTGDTSSTERSAQARRWPTVLVTTPESLSVMLARADAREALSSVRMVVVDEWHELLGNKRGVQTQLALARLKQWAPTLPTACGSLPPEGAAAPAVWQSQSRGPGLNETEKSGLVVWGMSATLGNLDEAMRTLLGPMPGVLVRGATPKKLVIDTLLPSQTQRFPWAGHLGLAMLPQVIAEIDASSTCLVFTNTRSQAELWFKAILEARPDWAGVLALHHGSLDRGVREWVEGALKSGQLKAAICTSSLDLGVDFLPVERVLQIGSTKGVARLLQRAGRSGHAPGRPSRITLVPTHSLELVEAAAARAAAEAGQVEARWTPHQPLDVLVQHLVTVALGGGFVPDALYAEVRQAAAFADLSQGAWQWCLDFVRQGGPTLAIYPDYQRVVPDDEGIWRVPDARLARRHRLNIGTISSDASMAVQFWSAGGQGGGARLGSIEENFIARLKPGECFQFAGRVLELVRVHQMTAFVKRATRKTASVPRWSGGRMPLSNTLADAMVLQLAAAAEGRFDSPEMRAAQPLLAIQQRWSALPTPQTLVAEILKSRDGWHLFVYPFAGRNVHLGLGNLLAWRAAREQPATFSIAVNDYGLELLSASEVDWATRLPALLAPAASPDALLDEVLASLNASELARRKFRDIARVSGLIFNGTPDERKSSRQLQASSSLFYNVFRQYDPANELLQQADRELLQDELEIGRLTASLARMAGQQLVIQSLSQPTPFSFPLMVERLREQLSNETLADRIARMVAQLETTAGADLASGQPDDVLKMLAFGQDVQAGSHKGKPRRPRKPSRPLPLL